MRTFTSGRARTRAFIGAAMVAAFTIPAATAPPPVHAGATGVALFDWSMPDRYGLDANGDGVTDSYVATQTCTSEDPDSCTDPVTTAEDPVVMDTWHVDLDACASTGAVAYDWSVRWRPSVSVELGPGGGCGDFFAEFPDEGTYQVGLRVKTSLTGDWSEFTWQDVVVQDWLIVVMGDSYGSGEGAPDVPIDPATLPAVADAWGDLGDALAELADLGPCAPGTGFDFDDCTEVLDDMNHAVVEAGADLIEQLDDPICDVLHEDFDLFACIDLLVALGLDAIGKGVDAIAAMVEDEYDEFVEDFQAVFEEAQDLVDSIRAVIDNFRNGAKWMDRRCHRSANVGSSLAAIELERRDPRTSVTYVSVACTGAMISTGLLGVYAGAEDEKESTALPPLEPQVDQIADLIGDREIDVVNLSIGGNDANFGGMIFACILRTDCTGPNATDDPSVNAAALSAEYCPVPFADTLSSVVQITNPLCLEFFDAIAQIPAVHEDAASLFEKGLNGDPANDPRSIADKYAELNLELIADSGLGLPDDRTDRVYITEYVNPLLAEDFARCNDEDHGLESMPGLSREESIWLDEEIVDELTNFVFAAHVAHGWNFVGDIVSGFEGRFGSGHGYCAQPEPATPPATAFGNPQNGPWIVQLQDAFLAQGNKMGAVHPNRSGYRHQAQQILPAWLADLYADPATMDVPRRPDQLPFADAGPNRALNEGDAVVLANHSYDGDGDPLTYEWTVSSPAFSIPDFNDAEPTMTALDDGTAILRVVVDDGDEGESDDQAIVQSHNVAPSVASGSASSEEGSAFIGAATFSDPGPVDTHTATIDYGDGSGMVGPIDVFDGTVPLAHVYADEGSYTVTVTVTDDDGGSGVGTFAVTVTNAAPVVGTVTAPVAPVLIGTTVSASAPFTDAGVLDTHTATIDWGDGATTVATVTESGGSGSASGSHAYTATGIYTVTVHVADGDGGAGSNLFQYVVVYDPTGGFVTGGGTIQSPAGAYRPDPTVSGQAVFAFVSKYQKGANVPDGSTSFRFNAADFVFKSASYDWLVVSGSKATYKGFGTVNGAGTYRFLLSAVDDAGGDRLRLKVWDPATGDVVYDNLSGAGDDATPTTTIAGGNIQVGRAK